MLTRRRAAISLAILAILATAGASHSQEPYPTRPVRWVVPFAPGGPADFVARTLAQHLGQRWGQPVVVDNRPGANTVIGATSVVRSSPDGYTLLQPLDATLTTNGFLLSTPPYDSLQDFTHIIVLASLPLILVTPEKLPVKSVADLVALARQQPGGLTYAHVTPGVQVLTEQFAKKAGLKLRAIPYKSTADVVKAILSGEVDFAFDGGTPYLPHIQSGRVRALATTGARRPAAFSSVPTLREAGVDLPPVTAWHGLSAPKGLPDAVRLKIERDVREVLAVSEVREKLSSAGLEVEGKGQAEYVDLIRRDMDRIGPAIKELGISIN